jgi:hypothetical protein
VLYAIEFWELRCQDHRGFADREKYPLSSGIGDAPSWPSGQISRPALTPIEIKGLKFGSLSFVADAGDHRQPQVRNDRYPVWSVSGIENSSRFKGVAIDPSKACRPAVCYKDLTVVSNNACRFRKIVQGSNMTVRAMVDYFNAVAARVRDEHAARLRIESAMVER